MNAIGSVLLDTTIVVEHLRGKSPSIGRRFKETSTLYLPLTALGELLYGAYKSDFEAKGLKQVEDSFGFAPSLALMSGPLTFTGGSKPTWRGGEKRFRKMISGSQP